MTECQQIEVVLVPYVDGVAASQERQAVEAHLGQCPACRRVVEQQRAVRTALQAHAPALVGQAPPGLRTRLAALAAEEAARPQRAALGWPARLGAFAAAATLVLAVSGAALSVLSPRSDILFAAQLALDHLKCFVIDGHTDQPAISAEAAESAFRQRYGWALSVPDAQPDAHLRLVAVRRCLYGEGWVAHVLYRLGETPVSVYVLPDTPHTGVPTAAFGQGARVVPFGRETLVVVAPSDAADRVAALVSTKAE